MTKQLMLASVLFFLTPVFADDVEKGLSKYFSPYPRVKVSQIGPVYVLDGTVDEIRDVIRVNEIAALLNEKGVGVRSFVELSGQGKESIAALVEKQINSPEIMVRFVNNKLFIEGLAINDFEADRAVEIAKALISASIARRPAQDDSGVSYIVDMLKVLPAAPPMPLPKTKKLPIAP